MRHDGATLASSIAYYALLSVFPLILLASALADHLLDPEEAQAALARTLGTYPPRTPSKPCSGLWPRRSGRANPLA